MTDGEVLQKAFDNIEFNCRVIERTIYPTVETTLGKDNVLTGMDYEKIIFSHSFAKAFWGDITYRELNRIKARRGATRLPFGMFENPPEFLWQYHLQQMVLLENPIEYLRKFI